MTDSKNSGKLFNCDETCTRKIIVACDGSEHSIRALNFYFDNVMKLDDHVFLYHAFELPSMPSAPYPYGFSYYEDWSRCVKDADDKAVETLKEIGETFVKKVRERFPEAEGRPARPHIQLYKENGHAGEVICSFCKDVQPDLLVVGSRGQGTVRRTLLGSVSDYCIHHNTTHVPIMVVRPPPEEDQDLQVKKD